MESHTCTILTHLAVVATAWKVLAPLSTLLRAAVGVAFLQTSRAGAIIWTGGLGGLAFPARTAGGPVLVCKTDQGAMDQTPIRLTCLFTP